ncbi:MAG: hypothetical protein ALAOOOJD_00347 [bacterium]|nr:hypothetical protein [bacterium]
MFDENLLPFIARLNPTIMWIALTVGLLLFVIGYFAGGKLAMGRIGMCVLLVTIIGVLALPLPMRLFSLVEKGLNVKTSVVQSNEANKKSQTPAKPKPAKITADSTATDGEDKIGEGVPFSLQLLTFILYLVWSSFLIAMGIFLYETLTVTAEEAEKR